MKSSQGLFWSVGALFCLVFVYQICGAVGSIFCQKVALFYTRVLLRPYILAPVRSCGAYVIERVKILHILPRNLKIQVNICLNSFLIHRLWQRQGAILDAKA